MGNAQWGGGSYGQQGPWLKLTRTANSFGFAFSSDGINWHNESPLSMAMSESMEIGLYVTSWRNDATATGVFDSFSYPAAFNSDLGLGQSPAFGIEFSELENVELRFGDGIYSNFFINYYLIIFSE